MNGGGRGWVAGLAILGATLSVAAQPFYLPTPNRSLLQPGREDRYFVGTTGKPWSSGTFGCTRSEGRQFHEGLDIRAVERDAAGEPADPILAAADGVMAYVNRDAALSTYGRFVILRHRIEGMEIFTLYAHLSRVPGELVPGRAVRAGEVIATMGRTANTREGISRERAHLHFEIGLKLSERFAAWFKRHEPNQKNDHGDWNGRNFVGLDPWLVFREEIAQRTNFSLLRLIRGQTELCRVLVRETDLGWARRYPQLVVPNPKADREGIAGYELALNYYGLPFRVTPRAASEIKGKAKVQLLSVNAAEQRQRPCGKLVTWRRGRWQLTTPGERLISLLTY